jgi:hypothetical protein
LGDIGKINIAVPLMPATAERQEWCPVIGRIQKRGEQKLQIERLKFGTSHRAPRRQGRAAAEAAGSAAESLTEKSAMRNKSYSAKQLVMYETPGLGQIRVDMDAFFELSFWMAEELEDLVSCWAHQAAPAANRKARKRRENLRQG